MTVHTLRRLVALIPLAIVLAAIGWLIWMGHHPAVDAALIAGGIGVWHTVMARFFP